MLFCHNCGQQIDDAAQFCPFCGAAQGAAAQTAPAQPAPAQPAPAQSVAPQQYVPQPAPGQYVPQQAPVVQNPDDSGSFGWAILGFCLPIVGLILFLVWKDSKPKTAHVAGKGALVGAVLGFMLPVLSSCMLMF